MLRILKKVSPTRAAPPLPPDAHPAPDLPPAPHPPIGTPTVTPSPRKGASWQALRDKLEGRLAAAEQSLPAGGGTASTPGPNNTPTR